VSGSAALPSTLSERWMAVTGQRLLERYGMTEFAMAISNPLDPLKRKLSSVGHPMPGFEVRFAAEDSTDDDVRVLPNGPGELQMRGPGVFREYWGRPEATKESFTSDGWFKTGDRAVRTDDGYISIEGRLSMDIIKSKGYKISALDIERIMLENERIEEIAVLGVPHEADGEEIAAVIALKPAAAASAAASAEVADEATVAKQLQEWCKPRMPGYRIPSIIRFVKEIPRNAMGKVNKKELRKNMFPEK
jgi:malonyl-CoA/methylmalonyl-CoA synthetase